MMKLPIIVENSKIPVFLSKLFNINFVAVSFAIFIFFKDKKINFKDKITEIIWRHEMIHYRQQKEMYFIGHWIMYIFFYFQGLYKYKNKHKAYKENPFEREAYANQKDPIYLVKRKKYSWKKYRD